MSQTLLSLAGFQVILIGRFWVIAEDEGETLEISVRFLVNRKRPVKAVCTSL